MPTSNAVPGFLPSINGFHFANRFPPGPTLKLGVLDPRWVGIGDAAAGLCGGMAWSARERFVAGRPIPPDTEAPANGSPLFRSLVRNQVQSLRWFLTSWRFWWAGVIGAERTLASTRDHVVPGVEATIERHQPRVAVVNAGGAEFAEGGLIIMGIDDVREVAARVPTVVAVHLEALNHCYLTRAAIRASLPDVLVPADGETLEIA